MLPVYINLIWIYYYIFCTLDINPSHNQIKGSEEMGPGYMGGDDQSDITALLSQNQSALTLVIYTARP